MFSYTIFFIYLSLLSTFYPFCVLYFVLSIYCIHVLFLYYFHIPILMYCSFHILFSCYTFHMIVIYCAFHLILSYIILSYAFHVLYFVLYIYCIHVLFLYYFHISIFMYCSFPIFPYLVEFDETPNFWYPRVARDAWINLASCSDQFRPSESRRSEKNQNIGFFEF